MLSATERDRLSRLGAGAELLDAFDACPGRPGRVVRSDGSLATVATATDTVLAHPPVDHDLCVGDWVGLATGAEPAITAVLARRSAVRRRDSGARSTLQLLAVNVDDVAVVVGVDTGVPATKTERFLATAWDSGATPLLMLTKSDLLDPAELAELVTRAETLAPGVEVFAVSVRTGAGLPAVAARLGPGRSLALLGTSGAGKSSLVNALAGADVVSVGELSASHRKGRHTTTWRELVELPGGGVVLDTPGLRGLGLWLEGSALEDAFADIAELAADCRFSDCAHVAEPGCAVLAAIGAGALDQRRLASLRKLEREASWTARRADARLRAEARRIWTQRAREARGRTRP